MFWDGPLVTYIVWLYRAEGGSGGGRGGVPKQTVFIYFVVAHGDVRCVVNFAFL